VIFLEQLSLFQVLEGDKQPKFQLLDLVKVQLIDERIDSEAHHYRKYYEPHILNKVGEILQVHVTAKAITYEVEIYGAKYYLLEDELCEL